jgi:stage II sporulation protein D
MSRPRPRPGRLRVLRTAAAAVAATIAAGLLAAPQAAGSVAVSQAYAVPKNGVLKLTGHGYGHGHGMSQYGARGAARDGLSHAQILGFYYPGTQMGSVGGNLLVRITADTDRVLELAPAAGLRFKRVGVRGQTVLPKRLAGVAVTSWRARAVDSGTVVEGLAGRWRPLPSGTVPGVANFWANGPVTLRLGSTEREYRGSMRLVQGTTVNTVRLEDYLRGVVPREIPASWEAQAVRAQAVAARSYAAWERANAGSRAWHSCDTTSCQVYGGVAAEHPASDAAVLATAGQIRTYQGSPAFTQFSASSGGWLGQGSMPYLVSKRDPYDAKAANPHHTWSTTVTRARIQSAYPALGTLRRVVVTHRTGGGDWRGRVERLVLDGSKKDVVLTGAGFRSAFGLKSDWFAFG